MIDETICQRPQTLSFLHEARVKLDLFEDLETSNLIQIWIGIENNNEDWEAWINLKNVIKGFLDNKEMLNSFVKLGRNMSVHLYYRDPHGFVPVRLVVVLIKEVSCRLPLVSQGLK